MPESTSGAPPIPHATRLEHQTTLPLQRIEVEQHPKPAEAPAAPVPAVAASTPPPQPFSSEQQVEASRLFDELPPPGSAFMPRTGPAHPLGVGRMSAGLEPSPLDRKLKWAGYLSGLLVLAALIWLVLHGL